MEYRKLIENICEEEKIDFKLISEDWVMILAKGNITKCISGYRFPLNDHGLGSIIDDKYAFYDLCKLKKIPIIEHRILFNPNSKLGKDTINLTLKYFNEFGEDVVIKPNNGTEGIDVYHITEKEELLKTLDILFKNNFSISICPFYIILKEYRVVVLNNQVKLIYEKNKPVVMGDGVKTIKELLIDLNPFYFKDKLGEDNFNKILNKNEIFEYDWRFNLSRGATAKLIDDKELYDFLSKKALEVCQIIGAKFVTVDIINSNNKFYLMEVNSGVCINKACNFIDKDLKITKSIYKDAIRALFD